jgi:hypothetical protein
MAQPKGQSRLQVRVAERPKTVVTEAQFRGKVWTRDKSRCRCCGRKVIKTIERVPERGDVHHIHGRAGDLRFDDRAALLVCCEDHERVTGRVNEKVVIVPSATFQLNGKLYTNARFPVEFKKAV